jgi:hypothetical protein
MVRTITGEIICAGESQRKVFVRKLPNIGNIDQLCNLVSKNYSINFKSVKPSAAMQPNGVLFNRAEWQISEYSNTDFGPDAWQYGSNWSFHVSPNTEYNMGPPSNITYLRSMVFFQGGLSPSAGGTFYIRARGIFTMINPDNNQETIEITSAWKNKAADFTITSTPTLCPSHIVVTPDPVIKGTDHNISFVTPKSISLPATGEILDQRGNSVIRFEISNPLQTIPVEKLDLAGAVCDRLIRQFPDSAFIDEAVLQQSVVARKRKEFGRAISLLDSLLKLQRSPLRGEAPSSEPRRALPPPPAVLPPCDPNSAHCAL